MTDQLDACAPFIEALAEGSPTPGGGAAAALTGELAAALTAMVCNVTVGREDYRDVESEILAILAHATRLRDLLHALVREDMDAYDGFLRARRLPRETDAECEKRDAAIDAGILAAIEAPLATMRRSIAVMELAARAAARGNRNAATDGTVGVVLAYAAVRAAHLNVRANLASVRDVELRERLGDEAAAIAARAADLEARAVAALS